MAIVIAAIGLFMAVLGLVRGEPGSILFGVAVLAIAGLFGAFYMLTQIPD